DPEGHHGQKSQWVCPYSKTHVAAEGRDSTDVTAPSGRIHQRWLLQENGARGESQFVFIQKKENEPRGLILLDFSARATTCV
ncbi:MAG: hypothetical protein VX520_05845, partial [Planctomycetota bacterium]|nr:hypothetical protein [Planctomycetota bacterium]